jgi:phospholipid transport system transporter-binding protein
MTTARLETRGDGRFAIAGDLSFATVPVLWNQSQQPFATAADAIDIDLATAGRADSAGLALLVAWTRWARESDKSIRFLNAPAQIIKLAEVNNLDGLLALEAA